MKQVIRYSPIVLALAPALAGCQGTVLDIGPDNDGGGASQTGSSSGQTSSGNTGDGGCAPVPVGPPDAAAGDFSSLAGTWTGYLENYQFPSGSDAVVITLSTSTSGARTIVFGQGSPPAPPTDGTTGYTPNGAMGSAILSSITEGFVYTVLSPSLDGSRLRFGVETLEPYRPWCELQTSYSWTSNACVFGCLPNWAGQGGTSSADTTTLDNPDGGMNLIVNTGVFTLCNPYRVCDCGPAGCTVRLDQPDWTVDMQFTTGHLDGSIAFSAGEVHNMHLTGP